MTGNRTINLLGLVALMVGVLTVAACGATKPAANRHTPPHRATTIGVADNGSLGRILVDSQGRTLYLFKADTTTRSTCFGACATAWPPLRVGGNPTAGGGANTSLVATTRRPDGVREATYDGHPLYLYQGDTQPGQVNGQGVTAFGAQWLAVSPTGGAISSQTSGTAPGGGY
jgi:predicted lipoprotein with Yx(FWY)xxD motif